MFYHFTMQKQSLNCIISAEAFSMLVSLRRMCCHSGPLSGDMGWTDECVYFIMYLIIENLAMVSCACIFHTLQLCLVFCLLVVCVRFLSLFLGWYRYDLCWIYALHNCILLVVVWALIRSVISYLKLLTYLTNIKLGAIITFKFVYTWWCVFLLFLSILMVSLLLQLMKVTVLAESLGYTFFTLCTPW